MEGETRSPLPADQGQGRLSELPRAESNQASSPHPTLPPSSDSVNQEIADDANTMANTTKTSSKKKKGTASVVKAPSKRARPGQGATGTAKKAKGGGSKKAKADVSSKQTGATTADGVGIGDSSESDNGPYCLCRGPDDHRFMIACDRCEDWFHGECIGMDKHTGENLVQKYICPNCTDGGRYTTRYKKMCSLSGCNNPARIYDTAQPSIFCSPEHCQAWWEQLIATLPRKKGAATNGADILTQEEFIGLLDTPNSKSEDGAPPWRLGKTPFETPPNFWDSPASSSALTPEERALLSRSAAERYQLGEEIVLCKKMLQLIDLALRRREAAIAAGRGTAKELCGYDFRLDTVGATHQFAVFLQSPRGEAIFKAGRLDPPPPNHPLENGGGSSSSSNGEDEDPLTAGMCVKKKCKPHNGWSAILTKTVKHDMKELAAQAKEKLDAEQRVRDGAAGRFRRKMKERNGVVVYDREVMGL